MTISHSLVAATAVTCLVGLAGCKQQAATPTAPVPSSAETAAAEHGHEHAGGEHDHSVAGHGHGAGPHEGTLADWGGGKYHVEFTVDHDKTEATVYVLGGDEKTATPIDAEAIELSITDPVIQVTLTAAPQAGDPAGTASRFVGTHEKLGVVQEYMGTITGVVDGTPYTGEFKEQAHSH